MKKVCQHCEPDTISRYHISEFIWRVIFPFNQLFNPLKNNFTKSNKIYYKLNNTIMSGFFNIILKLGVVKKVKMTENDPNYDARINVVIEHANKINQPIELLKSFNQQTRFISTTIKEEESYFEILPTNQAWQSYQIDVDNKIFFKELLVKNGIPVAEGLAFWSKRKLIKFADRQLSYPLVVKPLSGSLSKHTTCNIRDKKQLIEAFRICKKISPKVIVERYVDGEVFRVTLVNTKIVGACRRVPASITGNGKDSIVTLINQKNKSKIDKAKHFNNKQPHKIPINQSLVDLLSIQGFNLKSKLPKNKKVILHSKIVLANGSDIYDVTNNIHQDNIKLFRKISKLCLLPVIGVDVIAKNLSNSYKSQDFAIIEANSLPFIDMHHYPDHGKSRNVAKAIWEHALSK